MSKTIEMEKMAESIAGMVIEWVDGGIQMGTNWRAGLAGVIQLRLDRLAAPVVERQEPVALAVFEGAMPESNGKSNFTVILHTGDIAEGICVYRSEYPDRARYEADCFRHLIGDPAFPEKPFICDYDADKHSGYVKPDTSPPAPVAVVQHPFADKVIRKLQRFMECAEDGQGADIGRHWFDLLTQLGLLNRVQRSPALWEITQQGEDCLDKVKELNQ